MRRFVIAALVTLTLASCADQNAYRVASDQQRAEVISAVRDYYALRNQLTAGLAIGDFWRTYPELSYEHDGRARGSPSGARSRCGRNAELHPWREATRMAH